jgi:hypothetical protein
MVANDRAIVEWLVWSLVVGGGLTYVWLGAAGWL